MARRTKRRKRFGGAALTALSLTQLMGEMQRRRGDLESRRADIAGQLEVVEAEIAQYGGAASGRRGRPRGSKNKVVRGRGRAGKGRGGKKSLVTVLQEVLTGTTMGVSEMADAALKAGHKSKSKSFRTIVSLALLNNPKLFKRVSRGVYTAR